VSFGKQVLDGREDGLHVSAPPQTHQQLSSQGQATLDTFLCSGPPSSSQPLYRSSEEFQNLGCCTSEGDQDLAVPESGAQHIGSPARPITNLSTTNGISPQGRQVQIRSIDCKDSSGVQIEDPGNMYKSKGSPSSSAAYTRDEKRRRLF
jgi:hypothetical protein